MRIKSIVFFTVYILLLSCKQQGIDNNQRAELPSDSVTWLIQKRLIPPPQGASEILMNSIASTPQPDPAKVSHPPTTAEGWKKFLATMDSARGVSAGEFAKMLQVQIDEQEVNGVITRKVIPAAADHQFDKALFVHLHGGAYTLNRGMAGVSEALLIAHQIGITVISVDYRMPPDNPFPAAQDDAVAVYKQLLKDYPGYTFFIGGTSAGGGLTLSTVLKLKYEGLPLPAAIFCGTPWTDLTKTGDSYFINDGIDRILIQYEGFLEESARLYAGDYDLKNPYLSPVYGEVSGFPPVFLLSGTRDLFLSNTVRMQRKLRDAGVEADLVVLEGQSHGDFALVSAAPESTAAFRDLKNFLIKRVAE